MELKKRKKLIIGILIAVVVLIVAVPLIVLGVSKAFTAQESVVRTDWEFETGDTIGENAQEGVTYAEAELGDGLRAVQLIPDGIDEEGFTYYDTGVQERLAGALDSLKASMTWTATTPLAVLNPFGTASNELYLYFQTDVATKVSYTIHVEDEDIPDYTAYAADASGQEYNRTHEFQIIGLVPGETNQVTMTISGSWGNARQIVSFTVEMPETRSGYATKLEVTDGSSDAAQAGGLFAMMRVNGYLGYGFFYDNDGILRYEMVLEGYGLDRMLFDGDEIITCVSSSKLARINGLGQVTRVYDLEGYELHHDIGFGADGEVLALAEEVDGETVEDRVLSIDLESGAVSEILDFTQVMQGYFDMTRPVTPTDDFFWQAGEWDWIHLNSLQYMPEDDSLIVSSRETSTIIKIDNIYDEPTVDYLIGSPNFWDGSGYEDLLLTQDGEFSLQAGQPALASRPTTACRTGSTMSPCSITTMQSAGAGRMISQLTLLLGHRVRLV